MAYGPRRRKGRRAQGTSSARLGDFIFSQTPYPNPSALKLARAQVYGPGRRFTAARPFKIADVRSKKARTVGHLSAARAAAILRQGLKWKIGNGKYRMSKVVRIPYPYYDPVLKKTSPAALVIGWEGAGGGS